MISFKTWKIREQPKMKWIKIIREESSLICLKIMPNFLNSWTKLALTKLGNIEKSVWRVFCLESSSQWSIYFTPPWVTRILFQGAIKAVNWTYPLKDQRAKDRVIIWKRISGIALNLSMFFCSFSRYLKTTSCSPLY